jgi:hypothetical protein
MDLYQLNIAPLSATICTAAGFFPVLSVHPLVVSDGFIQKPTLPTHETSKQKIKMRALNGVFIVWISVCYPFYTPRDAFSVDLPP